MSNVNAISRLPTGKPDAGLRVALGQVLAKGRDTPSGLYPVTTRNDVEHQVGYDDTDGRLWPVTGPLELVQNTGITNSKTLTAPSVASRVVAGEIPQPGLSGRPSRIGKYDWAVDARRVGLRESRPDGVSAPFVRSGLTPGLRKEALDYNVRNNLTSNEWFGNSMRHVFEQGNGYALGGPAWATSIGRGGVNVDVF